MDSINLCSSEGARTAVSLVLLVVVIMLIWSFIRAYVSEYCRPPVYGSVVLQRASPREYTQKREGMFPIEDPKILQYLPEFAEGYDLPPYTMQEPSDSDSTADSQFISGTYGDVPVNIYDLKDSAENPNWDHAGAIHVENSRTAWRESRQPLEFSTEELRPYS